MLNYFQIGPEVFYKIFKVFPYIYIGKLDPPVGSYAFQWILIESHPGLYVPNYFQI